MIHLVKIGYQIKQKTKSDYRRGQTIEGIEYKQNISKNVTEPRNSPPHDNFN